MKGVLKNFSPQRITVENDGVLDRLMDGLKIGSQKKLPSLMHSHVKNSSASFISRFARCWFGNAAVLPELAYIL